VNSQTTNDSRSSSNQSNQPSEAEIKKRAYEIFQRRGGRHGRDKEDWDQAVRELRAERQKTEAQTMTPQSPKTSPVSDSARAFGSVTAETAAKTSKKR
jgi:hypothetical protein